MRLPISALVLGFIAVSSAVAVDDGFTSGPNPKRITRRPDQYWDHLVKGAQVQQVGRRDAEGGKMENELANYILRAKKSDPAKLGVDTVKQYSGYLDDLEQDKHLFYCKWMPSSLGTQKTYAAGQGSSSRGMTRPRIPSSCGSTAARGARPWSASSRSWALQRSPAAT